MKSSNLLTTCLLISTVYSNPNPSSNALVKRDESGTFSCYTTVNLDNFSALCPAINYGTTNGLNVIEILYFALNQTNIPDDTMYNPQENIVCTTHGPATDINISLGGGFGEGPVSVGGSVSFSLNIPAPDNGGKSHLSHLDHSLTEQKGICLFTEGTPDINITDKITLKQARDLLYIMVTTPNSRCQTCGRIPIRYPKVKDGSGQNGGILKLDFRQDDNCIGKCVGPNSFGASPSASATPKSAGNRVHIGENGNGIWVLPVIISGLLFCQLL